MTLEEALEILHETLNQCGKDNPTFYGAIALKVALDYIEKESISKEKIRDRIKCWQLKKEKDPYNNAFDEIRIRELQELLGE